MSINEILEKFLGLVWRMFEYDMEVLSQPWMYYWLCIPAIAYVVFFAIKWMLILSPLTLPIRSIVKSFFIHKKDIAKTNKSILEKVLKNML